MFLWLAIIHDGESITQLPNVWTIALRHGSIFAGVAVATMIAALAIRHNDLHFVQSFQKSSHVSLRPTLLFIFIHVASMAAFFYVLAHTLQEPELVQNGGLARLAVWLFSGVLSVVALLRGVIGPSFLQVLRGYSSVFRTAGLVSVFSGVGAALIVPQWPLLAVPTLRLSSILLDVFFGGVDVFPEDAIITFDGFSVRINQACSGISGMSLIAAILIPYLIVFRKDMRFPQAFLILPAGAIISFLANSVRIAALLYIGARVDPELAVGSFHSMSGWIFFSCVSIGIMWGTQRIKWLYKSGPVQAAAVPEVSKSWPGDPVTVHLLPFMLWLALGMLAASVTIVDVDPFYPVRVVLLFALLWLFRRRFESIGLFFGDPGAGRAVFASASLGLGVALLWIMLSPHTTPEERDMPTSLQAMAPAVLAIWIVARLVGTVLIVPIIEELAFRGYLQRLLVSPRNFDKVPQRKVTPLALFGSAVAFGLMHQAILAGIIAGAAFSVATMLRGRLGDAILAHAVANVVLSGCVLVLGRWELW